MRTLAANQNIREEKILILELKSHFSFGFLRRRLFFRSSSSSSSVVSSATDVAVVVISSPPAVVSDTRDGIVVVASTPDADASSESAGDGAKKKACSFFIPAFAMVGRYTSILYAQVGKR